MSFKIAGSIKEISCQPSGVKIRLIPDCEFKVGGYAVLLPNEETTTSTNTVLLPFDEYLEIELSATTLTSISKHIRIVVDEIPEGIVDETPEGIVDETPEGIVDETPEGSNSGISIKSDKQSATVKYKLVELWQTL